MAEMIAAGVFGLVFLAICLFIDLHRGRFDNTVPRS
jgi:hypothetical protein